MAPKVRKGLQFDHNRVCNRVGCKNPPLADRDFCSGQCAAKTVEEFDEIAGDLAHFPGATISPEYCLDFPVTGSTK